MKWATAALAAALFTPALAAADDAADKAAAKAEIWPLEQSIYAGRSRGDMSAYIDNTAPGYMAWAPQNPAPQGDAALKATKAGVPPTSKERLTMEFVDLALNGDTAIIYYTTHRTQLFDGSPADERFETTHTWVKLDGKWKVLGGMARRQPKR